MPAKDIRRERETKTRCSKRVQQMDTAAGLRSRIGGMQPIWIATKAGERDHRCQERGKLKSADPRHLKMHTGCAERTFPRARP